MRRVANKWSKFNVLKQHSGVAKHIPETRHYSAEALSQMLGRYGVVVVKPLVGTGGNGVVKIESARKGAYRYHYKRTKKTVKSMGSLMHRIDRIRHKRSYMVQRGIRLVTIGGRPVDYRVKMVKQGAHWRITAVVARIARQGQFVTNLCSGGDISRGYSALRHAFPAKAARLKKETMRGVARTSTHLLEKQYPGIGQLGYDFGVDRSGRIWIFEVNTNPH